jgi:hypothetical protein
LSKEYAEYQAAVAEQEAALEELLASPDLDKGFESLSLQFNVSDAVASLLSPAAAMGTMAAASTTVTLLLIPGLRRSAPAALGTHRESPG